MARSLHELSPRAQATVFVLLCGLTTAGAWQLLIGPERSALESVRARLTQVENDVAKMQSVVKRLPIVQREVRALEVALRETTAVIPDEKDPQDILRSLHDLASESALEIATFTPKPVVAKSQHAEWPIQLGLEGTYHDLGRFFDRLDTMSRLISVSDLEIKTRTKATSKGTVAVSCLATTFVFKKDAVPAGLATPAFAQIPVGTRVGEPITGYDSGGRRDPFMSLIVSKRPTPAGLPAVARPATGLTSFSVSDVVVTGIVSAGTTKMVILQGKDRQSYVAKIGARIMDATIKSIDAQGVVFVELVEPGSTMRPQEYRKTLRPAVEVHR